MNPFLLTDKTILITGASSGIGRATAILCAEMGAKLIICGRNKERLEEVHGSLIGKNHQLFLGDLTEAKTIEQLIEDIPSLDGVVLSAGKGMTVPLQFASREKFDDIFNTNFFASTELLRLLIRKKKLNNGASVVVILSIGGTRRFLTGNAVYGATKAALESIVKYAAIELASKQIRVNGICPGMVRTPFIGKGALTEEQYQLDMQTYPLKRYGEPEDIANGAVYLLSDASSWVTGHSLVIDGGVTIN